MAYGRLTNFSFPQLRWRLHRMLTDRGLWSVPFSKRAKRRMLLVTCEGSISQSQVYPLFYFKDELRDAFGIEVREVSLDAFEAGAPAWQPEADIVVVQPWFDVEANRLRQLLEMVHERCKPERVLFFDSFAPTDLRLGHIVEPYIDLYVKKHVLRDRSLYGRPTLGDTNLMDHYCRVYGFDYPTTCFPVSQELLQKLIVGPSFVTADFLSEAFDKNCSMARYPKRYDMHARIGRKGSDWYSRMRDDAQAAVDGLVGIECVTGMGASHAAYLKELSQSHLCFSPFGYGEVAWRDYEAIACGSLLIKPDCSHLEVDPDIFVPYETYVPIEWDFSDLAGKVRHYLHNEDERERITNAAFERLHSYFADREFLSQMHRVFE
ncbi:MAG: hypothetical protein ACI841_001721 [Planctomycetota bacterium]|jgi:hypothetical protein